MFSPGEAGVGIVCEECSFQTEDEHEADAHVLKTGHQMRLDYLRHRDMFVCEECGDVFRDTGTGSLRCISPDCGSKNVEPLKLYG